MWVLKTPSYRIVCGNAATGATRLRLSLPCSSRECLVGTDPQLVVESPLERSKEINGPGVEER